MLPFHRYAVLALWMMLPLPPAVAGGTLYVTGQTPPPGFIAAAHRAGFTLAAAGSVPADADVMVVALPVGPEGAQKQAAADSAAMLERGKAVLLSIGDRPEEANLLEDLMPINLWSCSGGVGNHNNFRRPDCGVTVPASSPFAGRVELTGVTLSARYDLHLPYAAIEAGEHRYRWRSMDKGLLNTDWSVLLTTDAAGNLPLLVSGRLGPGKTYVFGADLFDPGLIAAPGYAGLIEAILASATASATASASHSTPPPGNSAGLQLSIPEQQIGGLRVDILNPGAVQVSTLLAYKVSNSERGLLNSASQYITVPAGQTASVQLIERSPELGDLAVAPSGDSAQPYRYVRAALCRPDRTAIVLTKEALVDTCPPVTLSVEGEDVRSFQDLASWPDREMGKGLDTAGGAPIYRYVYRPGILPTVKVTLRNGLHNIAPLATPMDADWPGNPTIQGLNDLAESTGSVRGTYPLYGYWAGKAATEQTVSLTWTPTAVVSRSVLLGETGYRRWDRSNPTNIELSRTFHGDEKSAGVVKNAVYVNARHEDTLGAAPTDALMLHVTGLDPAANFEPNPFRDMPDYKGTASNCTLTEWEVLGWPNLQTPPAVSGHLVVTETDLLSGKAAVLTESDLTVDAVSEFSKALTLAPHDGFGPVRVDAAFTANGASYTASFNALFVPEGGKAIVPVPISSMGLLCSPGFIAFDEFGLGTMDDTQGWGGDDDKIWALTHDFMELGSRTKDQAARLFTTSARFCHYTCPWRDFPDGQYFWDRASDRLTDMVTTGKLKGKTHVHIFLSDRWNGIPVGATFAWADYIDFDHFLRQTTGHGLTGRSRGQIEAEITTQYGDLWQKWQMDRYADKLLAIQDRLARLGVLFTVTTHGSFPLVGGELGQKIGKTHVATGTDLFWELKNEDLYQSIGHRFGLIAANPDYQSGAYNEWGWCSGVLNNPHWFAETGAVEPSRRQWYSTYFAGRVTSDGAFEPLTVYGFHAQGGFGVKNTDNDWNHYYRTMELATSIRPESPSGAGLVVSWPEQIRHMGKEAGQLGTGLYAAKGWDQIDSMAGEVYQKLVKNGLAIGFVASTNTLKHWTATSPLVVVDGYSLDERELAELARLNALGAPIIAIGSPDRGSPAAAALFGVGKEGDNLLPGLEIKTISLGEGGVAYVQRRPGHGFTLFCPIAAQALGGLQARSLADAIAETSGRPVTTSSGIAVTSFISQGHNFLALGDQGDVNRRVDVSVSTDNLQGAGVAGAGVAGAGVAGAYRVIDLDRGVVLPFRQQGNRLIFSVPVAASDGRMVMILN